MLRFVFLTHVIYCYPFNARLIESGEIMKHSSCFLSPFWLWTSDTSWRRSGLRTHILSTKLHAFVWKLITFLRNRRHPPGVRTGDKWFVSIRWSRNWHLILMEFNNNGQPQFMYVIICARNRNERSLCQKAQQQRVGNRKARLTSKYVLFAALCVSLAFFLTVMLSLLVHISVKQQASGTYLMYLHGDIT